MTTSPIVIVGASLAGATAAATLRQEGYAGEILLVGAEAHPPYERPALSKQYLRSEASFEASLVRPVAFYSDNRIEALLGTRAIHVDPAERTVILDSGGRIRYAQLLVATGVRNRRPAIVGFDLQGIHQLRTVEDADQLRMEAVPGRTAVVAGMGFIGCEVAASLRQLGVSVIGVDPSPAPLFRALGPEIGRAVADLHRDHGVELVANDSVERFEGDRRVQRVVTKAGRPIDCDFAVVGVGVEPALEAVAGSGIITSNGILVDEFCRTNIEGVYAAGDIANHHHPVFGRRMRVEHWQNAMQQGAAAAKTMLGKATAYEPIHWFWSDQYNVNLQYAGSHHDYDELVIRGNVRERDFVAFYVNDGRVDAVAAMDRGKDVRRATAIIKTREVVDPKLLADDEVDLRHILSGAAS